MGLPLLVTGIASIVYAALARKKEALVLLAFLLPYLVLMSTSQVRFVRYSIPLLPCFVMFIALAASAFFTLDTKRTKKPVLAAVYAIGAISFIYCVSVALLFGYPDTRDAARNYITKNAAKSDAIGFLDLPWFYSPPLGKMIGYGTIDTRRKALLESEYPIVLLGEMKTVEHLPEWAVISDYEIDDALRLRWAINLSAADIAERDKILGSYTGITQTYSLVDDFERRVLWMSCSRLPHDMRYCAPRIRLYKLKQQNRFRR